MALYRTYRPASLDEVVGQEHVTLPLRRAIDNGRVHHAYLFSGPRGCGKTSTARILARSLNCEQGPTPDPCGVCQSCMDLAPNGPGSIDVIELDAASHGRVEDTRELRERAAFAPVSSRYKVYIIDEAHMVSNAGFNALLKLVEEPPEHVRFIFATTEAEKVIPTIRSRTHNYTFRLVPSAQLVEHLASVCEKEGVTAEPAALALIARAGAGSVRDSMSVLGQVIAGAGDAGVTYEEASAQLGLTDAALLDDVVGALADHDGAAMFDVVERVMSAGHEPRRFVTDLLERIRNLIVLQHVPGAAETGMIDAPEDEVSRQLDQAKRFGPSELSRAAEVISTALTALKGATAPRLQLELMAARLLLPAADDDEAGTRARLDALERRAAAAPVAAMTHAAARPEAKAPVTVEPAVAVKAEPVVADEPVLSEPVKKEPVKSEQTAPARKPPKKLSAVAPSTAADASAGEAPAGTSTAAHAAAPAPNPGVTMGVPELRSLWPAILEALKGYRRVAWMGFADSAPLSMNDGTLAVGVREQGNVANIKAGKNDELLRQAILDVARLDVRIDVVLAPDLISTASSGGAAKSAPAPASTSSTESAPSAPEPDAPSIDDENLDDSSGVDLALRALGATQIGEIEH
jgi:DNA polymerase III subunit gamma/tau